MAVTAPASRGHADVRAVGFGLEISRVQRGRRKLKARLLDCCHVEMARGGRVVELRHRESDCCAG